MTQLEIAERNRNIIHLAKSGKTADDISQIIGMKRYRVLQILRAYNVKAVRTSHVLKNKKAQDVIRELKAGTMQSDIARKLNVSRQYVSQIKLLLKKQNN